MRGEPTAASTDSRQERYWTRRATLASLAAGTGAGVFGLGQDTAAAEPPPETKTIRLLYDPRIPILCYAPQIIAGDLLRAEGFNDVRYMPYTGPSMDWEELAAGTADLSAGYASDYVIGVDNAARLTIVAGSHAGCVDLVAGDRVSGLNDLAGKRMVVTHPDGTQLIFLSLLLRYVGIDPNRDIDWVYEPDRKRWPGMLAAGEVDVVNAFPPQTFEMRRAGIGHVILDTGTDDPWRHHFCCLIAARSAFVRDHPIATRRALRALVKANQLCLTEPEFAARRLVELGATDNIENALMLVDEIPYDVWRDYDPATTVRFFALRLREAGLISSTPSEILESGTDFSFLDDLRREMKS